MTFCSKLQVFSTKWYWFIKHFLQYIILAITTYNFSQQLLSLKLPEVLILSEVENQKINSTQKVVKILLNN